MSTPAFVRAPLPNPWKGGLSNMPPQAVSNEAASSKLQDAFRKTKRIMSMLQGTMALEGQALDREKMKKMTAQTLLRALDRL